MREDGRARSRDGSRRGGRAPPPTGVGVEVVSTWQRAGAGGAPRSSRDPLHPHETVEVAQSPDDDVFVPRPERHLERGTIARAITPVQVVESEAIRLENSGMLAEEGIEVEGVAGAVRVHEVDRAVLVFEMLEVAGRTNGLLGPGLRSNPYAFRKPRSCSTSTSVPYGPQGTRSWRLGAAGKGGGGSGASGTSAAGTSRSGSGRPIDAVSRIRNGARKRSSSRIASTLPSSSGSSRSSAGSTASHRLSPTARSRSTVPPPKSPFAATLGPQSDEPVGPAGADYFREK